MAFVFSLIERAVKKSKIGQVFLAESADKRRQTTSPASRSRPRVKKEDRGAIDGAYSLL